MSSSATAAVDEHPGALATALSADEQKAWEERLGVQSDTISAWGRIVGQYLFAQPPYRQILHVAHAFRVMPFVAETPEDQFVLEPMSDGEFGERVNRLNRPDVSGVVATLGEHRSSATTMATTLLDVLFLLDADDRAVVLAVVFRRLKGLVPAELLEPGKTLTLTQGEREAIIIAERETARAIIGAIGHRGCDHTTLEDVAGQVLDALASVADPTHRKVMLGFAFQQLDADSRSATPSGLEALERILGARLSGG